MREKMFSLVRNEPVVHQRKVETRYNFASILGGAKILEKNPDCLYDKSVLDDNPDNYMINKCSTKDKYIVIRLTEDMLMHEFALVNREFYSSNLKNFEVFGSVSYPSNEWKSLGNFTALDIRDWQNFKLKKETWVRFVKFVFISHYGNAFHCTLSQIRIYGETMLVDFRNDMIKSFKEDFGFDKKKKPLILPNSRRTSSASTVHHKNSTIYHGHPTYNNKRTYSYIPEAPKNRTFLYIFDEYCDNIPFFSNSNSSEHKILVSNENKDECEESKLQKSVEGRCHNFAKSFRGKWRENQCFFNHHHSKPNETKKMVIKEHGGELDLGVDSIFKVLTKHIKVLKMNQIILQDFILKQDQINTNFQTKTESTYSLISKLSQKNANLTAQLEKAQKRNEDLSAKIESLSHEIKHLQAAITSESEFFLWKVLLISLISCLTFFIFGYCLYNFNNQDTQKKVKNKNPSNQTKHLELLTPKASLSNFGEIKSLRSKQKSKKKRESILNRIESDQILEENGRFSRQVDMVYDRELRDQERKRSCSVQDNSSFIWGFSPRRISKYIMNKIL